MLSKFVFITLLSNILALPIIYRSSRDLAAQNRLSNMRDNFMRYRFEEKYRVPNFETQIAKHLFDSRSDMEVLAAYLSITSKTPPKKVQRKSHRNNRLRKFRQYHH